MVEGASKGQGLGNQFLHNIREVDAIVHIVRAFEDENITHIDKKIDPQRDIKIINTELVLADLETAQKRIAKLEKQARTNDKVAIRSLEITKKLEEQLNKGDYSEIKKFIDELQDDFELVEDLHLLTFKPMLYVFNTKDNLKGFELVDKYSLNNFIEEKLLPYTLLNIKQEEDLLELNDREKQELELKSELSQLITKSYQLLNLITFLTTGEKETRAWQIPKDSSTPRAGRAIHSDFEEKFIKAEVIGAQELIEIGSRRKARDLGAIKLVGKDYIVQDGDVIEFKI